MKNLREAPFQPGRHEQRTPPRSVDAYRLDLKLPDPIECPSCEATYLRGRWTWHRLPTQAPQVKCPACRRMEDNVPGGVLTLAGPWFEAHRTEVLDRALAVEARERAQRPVQRIVAMRDHGAAVEVTTTDPHLARSIAVAIHDACKGELEMDFPAHGGMPRARWKR